MSRAKQAGKTGAQCAGTGIVALAAVIVSATMVPQQPPVPFDATASAAHAAAAHQERAK